MHYSMVACRISDELLLSCIEINEFRCIQEVIAPEGVSFLIVVLFEESDPVKPVRRSHGKPMLFSFIVESEPRKHSDAEPRKHSVK